ncbi:hypothetical protein [Anaeromusa acidaminophila]|uniref:hypothetical protein n=1 Tax=Anaeromusa acidaminophila TaxID=81464 RepID=UPI000364F3A1|nr:hypothetical protein [Anaeromusa acidaminophila]
MSKISEIDRCIGELRTAAQSLAAVADSLTALLAANAAPAVVFTQSGNGQTEHADTAHSKVTDRKSSSAPKPKPVTLEQVRAVLAEKSRRGHTAKVRELLQKHGAAKLSEIDPAQFEALLSEAAAIGGGEEEDG